VQEDDGGGGRSYVGRHDPHGLETSLGEANVEGDPADGKSRHEEIVATRRFRHKARLGDDPSSHLSPVQACNLSPEGLLRFRRLVAFHEAGRTVVAWDAGLRLPRVSIYPEEHTRGRILVGQEFPDGISADERREQWVYLRLLAAGPLAVVMAGGRLPVEPNVGVEVDTRRFAFLARRAGVEIDAVLRETATRLAYLWEPVEAVVNALLLNGSVSGALAGRLIRASHPGELLED
jgi:hypothetical protein